VTTEKVSRFLSEVGKLYECKSKGGVAVKGPSEQALKNFYEAIKPGLVRIVKEDKQAKENAS
jgi:hypothetical protein